MLKEFSPYAIILCERTVPEPIFVAALIGINRILRIDFQPGSPPITFAAQAMEGLSKRLSEFKSKVLPAFGKPLGFAVNYTEQRAVTFDLQQRPLRHFPHVIGSGNIYLSKGGRTFSNAELLSFFGPQT